MAKVVGYILENAQGKVLSGQKHWFYDRPIEGHVFTPAQYRAIQKIADTWSIMPAWVYRATYENGLTTIHGERVAFVAATRIIRSKGETKRKP